VAIILRVQRRLAQNIEQIPTLDELAKATGMSRFSLSRKFHRCVGISLRAYVRELRLKRACELLATSRTSITNASLECGFYDLAHFDKTFRARFGLTPTQFRRQHAQPRSL
jgi:transcriptional regulator GlxA family with amidase domain